MTESIVIIGCGGFGREVQDVIEAINAQRPSWVLEGYVDDSPSPENLDLIAARNASYLGTSDEIVTRPPAHYVIGVGNGTARRAIDARMTSAGWSAATLVHPDATVGSQVRLGEGSILCAGARLTTNIELGRHVHVNLNSTVGHDCVLADYVTVNPLVAISGWVTIGTESMLGTHSAILQNLSVGNRSVVGGASLVTKNVPDGVVVKGVPAR